MKIALDTEKDSPESIRKVIRLLHDLVNEPYTNYASPTSPASSSPATPISGSSSDGIFNLFAPPSSSSQQAQPNAQPQETMPSVFDVFKNDLSSASPRRKTPNGSNGLYRDDELYDNPDEDSDQSISSKPLLKMKESDPRAKKFQFPEDQISIIEY